MSIDFKESFEDYGIQGINPAGAREQRAVCPFCPPHKKPGSERSKDLAVNVDEGIWWCHRCGAKGGLKVHREHIRTFPTFSSKSKPLVETILGWFENKRKITKAVIERNRIGQERHYFAELEQEVEAITFGYYLNGELVNVKYRSGNKKWSQIKGGAKVFYKIDDIFEERECIITEGEMDALSFEVAGYRNAVSIPDGALNPNSSNITKKMEFMDTCLDYFKGMTKIFLALDTDPPGIRMRDELARRFGRSRCWIVRYPDGCKDANEVLVKHGATVLADCMTNSEPYPVDGIQYANQSIDELQDLYDYGYPNGARAGYPRLDDLVKFYDSNLTVITGIPSHGKSNFMDQLMVKLAINHGWKFGIFSPENAETKIHIQRLIEIIVGRPFLPNYNNQMSREEAREAREFINDHFIWIKPPDDAFTFENIFENASYLVAKHGIKGLVLDPWNTIEHDYGKDTETDYTGKALNRLLKFEREHGLHLFIVAHPKKMPKKTNSMNYEIPTAYDISGSQHWANKGETIMCVYRDFSPDGSSDTLVFVQKIKHRYMGRTGYVKFNFEPSCQRYYEAGSDPFTGNELTLVGGSDDRWADNSNGAAASNEYGDEPPF